MSKLWISEKMISRCFWQSIRSSIYFEEATNDANFIASVTAPKVDEFPSIAGSISKVSSRYLWLLTKYFSPKSVIEIGTYIGRSTLAISFGGQESIEDVYTCDGTYDCLNFNDYKTGELPREKANCIDRIRYHGKTMSTDLLGKILESNKKVDMVFIDGRISNEDCKILAKVMNNNCVIVLDDFEGVEKGVVNAMMLRNAFKGMILVEPAVEENCEVGNLAILVPSANLTLSRQQGLPVNM